METISNVNQVKNHNVRLVKNALKEMGTGTKNSVAKATGLSIATCNTILNELAEKREILEIQSEEPTVGRPPKLYWFNETFSYVCCIFPDADAKSWLLEYAITDLRGNIREESHIDCDEISVDVIADAVKSLIDKEPKIKTVSFGSPGYIYDNRIHSRGVPQLQGIDMAHELSERLGCDVYVENDMNAMAYGIYKYGVETAESPVDMVMVAYFDGSKMGSGIVVDGKILHGTTGFAGEIARLYYGSEDVLDMVSGDKDSMVRAAAIAVEAFTATINPAVVIFTGSNLSADLLPEIRAEVEKYIPKEHIPQLSYVSNFRKYYIQGLTAVALEASGL